jgi:YVTN family beta-propeller protein
MIAVSPDGKTLYVTSRDENQLLAVSAADLKVTAEVPTGDEPHGVSYRANSRREVCCVEGLTPGPSSA